MSYQAPVHPAAAVLPTHGFLRTEEALRYEYLLLRINKHATTGFRLEGYGGGSCTENTRNTQTESVSVQMIATTPLFPVDYF